MALSATQYASMKLTLRALLSGNSFSTAPNLGEGELLGFWNQLTSEAAAGIALSATLDSSIDFEFRSRLCVSIARVVDADWATFPAQLSTDSSGASALPAAQYARLKLQLRALLSAYSLAPGTMSEATLLGYLMPRVGFSGLFASLFTSSYQVVQTDIIGALLYGSTPLATAGNTSTTVVALSGTLSTIAVPVWWKATNSASIGAGATFNIYYDGTGTTPAMTGVTPTAGTPVPLTGAGAGLSATWVAGTSVNNDTWKATCAGLVDQSGNFQDYGQATLSKQPLITLGVNGKPGVLLDGVDDILTSTCALPLPSTTPWVGFMVMRRPTTAAGAARMVADNTAEVAAIILDGATQFHMYMNGTFGPIVSGHPTNTWGAIDYMYSSSASDYLRVGSVAQVAGAGAGNLVAPSRSIGGATVPPNIEVVAVGYVPASAFSAAAFRAAVTSLYGATVNV